MGADCPVWMRRHPPWCRRLPAWLPVDELRTLGTVIDGADTVAHEVSQYSIRDSTDGRAPRAP